MPIALFCVCFPTAFVAHFSALRGAFELFLEHATNGAELLDGGIRRRETALPLQVRIQCLPELEQLVERLERRALEEDRRAVRRKLAAHALGEFGDDGGDRLL
jgi:hypothetical protein